MGASCSSKRAAELAEAPTKPPPAQGGGAPCDAPSSDAGEGSALPEAVAALPESPAVAVLLAELPHLAGSDVPRRVARSLCRAGAVVTQDDGTYRAPAVELMRIWGDLGGGSGAGALPGSGAPLLSGDALTGMLESFVRPAMADSSDGATGARDCTPAEAASAVGALRSQLHELAAQPALGITVDDLEAWLEHMDAAAAQEEEEEAEEAGRHNPNQPNDGGGGATTSAA